MSAAKLRLYEEKRYVTARVSETSRYIGYGVLALFYSEVHHSSSAVAAPISHLVAIYAAGVAAVLTVLTDYLQYVFGAWSVNRALKQTDPEALFDDEWWSYRLRNSCFVLKQVFACSAAAGVLYLVLCSSG